MSNRLKNETSPYLLQHAENPVDWYPWSAEALDRAKSEDLPIFLSIGYSACHWCHVMEHESFEDVEIANFLNAHYVNIKVDREERPDLDHIYMQSVMALRGGQGGWPLSAFLTPERHVFFGGTYWPPRSRMQMPGFDSVIRQVHQAFREQRNNVEQQAARVTQWLVDSFTDDTELESPPGELPAETDMAQVLNSALAELQRAFDFTNGGFGSAPKFPHPMDLQLLLECHRDSALATSVSSERQAEMVRLNLVQMAQGGIRDHIGGGFARYSVDERWLVPHFEKMLYDNAQLLRLYAMGSGLWDDADLRQTADEIVDYLLRDMLDPEGGFHSSEDADSEGVEGKFYVWDVDEVQRILGAEAGSRFCRAYDITRHGNFEGHNIPNLPCSLTEFAGQEKTPLNELRAELAEGRAKLFAERERRVRPGKDDKVLTNWNALAIDGLAAYLMSQAGPEPAAEERIAKAEEALANCVSFALQMVDGDGRLLHSWRQGNSKIPAFLDDYSCLINALVTVAEWDWGHSVRWLGEASRLANEMLQRFSGSEDPVVATTAEHGQQFTGGLYFTQLGQDDLVTRFKDHHDGSVPSGNGMAAFALARLGRATGIEHWSQCASAIVRWALPMVQRAPMACGQMLRAMQLLRTPPAEIVIRMPESAPQEWTSELDEMRRVVHAHRGLSASIIALGIDGDDGTVLSPSVFAGKAVVDDKPTAYLCENFTCLQPICDPSELARQMRNSSGGANRTQL